MGQLTLYQGPTKLTRALLYSKSFKSSGIRVQGLGIGVKNLGFRIKGFGFWIKDLRFRVEGLFFWVQGLGFRVWGSGATL